MYTPLPMLHSSPICACSRTCAWLQMRVPAPIWASGDTSAVGWIEKGLSADIFHSFSQISRLQLRQILSLVLPIRQSPLFNIKRTRSLLNCLTLSLSGKLFPSILRSSQFGEFLRG